MKILILIIYRFNYTASQVPYLYLTIFSEKAKNKISLYVIPVTNQGVTTARYGIFSTFSCKNIPYRNFVPRENTVRNSTVRNFFRIVISYLSVPFFFQPVCVKKNSAGNFFHCIFFMFSCIFILLLRESDQCAIRVRLGVASHLSTTPRWGNPAKCVSKRYNK